MTEPVHAYAQSMPFGGELDEPLLHLRNLLDEANEYKSAAYFTDPEWVTEMVVRDAAIARCALVVAHRLLKAHPSVIDGSTDLFQIESALEWIFRA